MKKVIAFLLTVITFLSVAAAAFALTDTQQQILKHYEEVMSGTWKHIADELEFTFEPERLLIAADNKVYYNYYSKDLSLISGRKGHALAEVLLSNDSSIIVLKKYSDFDGYELFLFFQKMD